MTIIVKRIPLKRFLLKHLVRGAEIYTNLKFSGGRDSSGERFAGTIPITFSDEKIFTITLPYVRNDLKVGLKPDGESNLEIAIREGKEEIGFEFDANHMIKICEDIIDGFLQIFYGVVIPLVEIPDMKQFPYKNRDDTEKGKPIFTEFLDILPYLPPAHLKAARIFMEKLADDTSQDDLEILLQNRKDDLELYIGYAYRVIEAIDMENEYRDEMRKKNSKKPK